MSSITQPPIRIGCCLNMIASGKSGVGQEYIPLFAHLGYDYVELPLAQLMELSDAEFVAVKKVTSGCNIKVEACNNFFPATHRLTGENANHHAALEYARFALEKAAELGAEIVVLGSSGAKNIPAGFPTEKAREQFVQLLGNISSIADPLGITVAIEPLNKLESNFVNTVTEGYEIAQDVSKPAIGLLADYYHLRMEDEPLSAISEAGNKLCHIHLAAKKDRVFPKADDGEDYAAFIATLKAGAYSGRISIEAFSDSVEKDAEQSLALMKKII